jgi:hypothetical protein
VKIVRREEWKIVVWGISAFPGEITGFVSGHRYHESTHDLPLLPPPF